MQDRKGNGIPSADDLVRQRKPLRNPNAVHEESLSRLDRLAVAITQRVGSMAFFFLILGWTVLWLVWNTLGPRSLRFDPFPAFVLWLFISNMIQILLMPLLLVGQNLQGRHAETRAENDFHVNVKSEREIEVILRRLERQEQLEIQILQHLEVDGPAEKP